MIGITENTEIEINTVTSEDLKIYHPTFGMCATSVQGVSWCGNTLENLGEAMNFGGNCDYSTISQNNIHLAGIGLSVTDRILQGVIGDQIRNRNVWLEDGGDYIVNSARYSSSASIDMSEYLISNGDFSNELFNPDNVFPAHDWFVESSGANELCYSVLPLISRYDSLIILEMTAYDTLSDQVKFYLLKNLLHRILADGGLTTVYDDFLDEHASSTEMALAEIELEMKSVMQMAPEAQQSMDSLIGEYSVLLDTLMPYIAWHHSNLDSSTTFAEGIYYDSIQAKLSLLHGTLTDWLDRDDTRLSFLDNSLSDVWDKLDAITPRASYDAKYITIYKLLIKRIIDGGLSPSDLDDLNDIAQDFADSSMANIVALAFFDELCSEDPYPDFTKDCPIVPYRQHPLNSPHFAEVGQISLANMKESAINDNNLLIRVFNMAGQEVLRHNNPDNMDVERILYEYDHLSAGAYYFVFADIQTGKVVKSGLTIKSR